MGTHYQPSLTGGHAREGAPPLGSSKRPRYELNGRERAKERLDRSHVLVSEDFSRRKQSCLAACIEDLKHGP